MLTKYYLLPWFLVLSTGGFSSHSPRTLQIPIPTHSCTTHPGTSLFLRHLRWLQHLIPSSNYAFFFPTLWICFFLKHIFLGKICMSSLQSFRLQQSIICPLKSQPQLIKQLQCIHLTGGRVCYLVQRWQWGWEGKVVMGLRSQMCHPETLHSARWHFFGLSPPFHGF